MYWGHKASVLGFPRQGVPLDARAIRDLLDNAIDRIQTCNKNMTQMALFITKFWAIPTLKKGL